MFTELGKYRLIRRLGAGGMGEVWEALDTVLGRSVAVKMLNETGGDDVIREAAAAAKVNHPNAVGVYDAATANGRWFLVMEFVAGTTAARRVADLGRLPWVEATCIARDAAAGLTAVHAAGLVHRDVKPSNILLTSTGTAKLADFGIARQAVRTGQTTRTGTVGTPLYMSPEQCWSEAADGRADVYSLGATYYTLLTGRPPYEAPTETAVMYAHCHAAVPDPKRVVPDLPDGCVAVVRRAMAKQPNDRFPSAVVMQTALEEVLAGGGGPVAVPPVVTELPPATVQFAPRNRRWTRRVVLSVVPVFAFGIGTSLLCNRQPAGETRPPTTPPDPLAELPEWSDSGVLGDAVQQIAVSPDGRLVAVTVTLKEGKGELHLRTRDGVSLAGWPRPVGGVEGVAFSPDGKLMVAAARGGQAVLMVDVATGSKLDFEGDLSLPVASQVAFSLDGTRLAIGGYDSVEGMRIECWTREKAGRWRKLPRTMTPPEYELWGLAFVPGPGRHIVVAGLGRTTEKKSSTALRFFDVDTGETLPSPAVEFTRRDMGPALAFAADGSVLVVGTPGRVHRLRVADLQPLDPPLRLPEGNDGQFWAVAVSPDGTWVAGGQDIHVLVWRAADGVMKPMPKSHTGRVHTLAFSSDGRLLSGGEDGRVRVHDHVAEFR